MLAFLVVPFLTEVLLASLGFADPQAGIDGHPGFKGVGLPLLLGVWMVALLWFCYAEFYREWEEKRKAGSAASTGVAETVGLEPRGELVAMIDSAAWPTIASRPDLMASLRSVVEDSRDAEEAYRLLEVALSSEGLRGALLRPPS